MLLTALRKLSDRRRVKSKKYQMHYILYFSILAILSNAKGYRDIATFIDENFKYLKKRYKLRWKNPPSYSTIRRIILSFNSEEFETTFKSFYIEQIKKLPDELKVIAIDGKTIKGSFDNFNDKSAVQILSAFFVNELLILDSISIEDEKTNEIPLAQEMIKHLGLEDVLITMDALHCQKKL